MESVTSPPGCWERCPTTSATSTRSVYPTTCHPARITTLTLSASLQVLFYKVGGTTRISGFLLAAASFGILVAGPGIISLLPVCIVGALIFILAIDLIKEVSPFPDSVEPGQGSSLTTC